MRCGQALLCRPELLAAQRQLLLAERIGLADLQRHLLPAGAFLRAVREHERLGDVIAGRHGAVRQSKQ